MGVDIKASVWRDAGVLSLKNYFYLLKVTSVSEARPYLTPKRDFTIT